MCRVKLVGTPEDEWLYGVMLAFWSVNLAYASTLPREVREMYLCLAGGLIVWVLCSKRLPIAIAVATMLISSVFLTSSFAVVMHMLTASSIGFSVFLLWMYVPVQFLLLSMTLGLGLFYTFAILVFALSRTDPLLGAILFSGFVYLWYLIVRARPPQRNV